MIEFQENSLNVDTFDLNHQHISWRIEDTDEDLAKFRFSVSRSGSPEGPFTVIVENLSNQYEFFDKTVNQQHKWRKYYYKVSAIDVTTDDSQESLREAIEIGPEKIDEARDIDYIGLEIRRRNEQILLPRYSGTRVAIFVCKTFGQRCHYCWDVVKKRQRTSTCSSCYNTGYVGGYFPQINGWVNMTPPADAARVSEFGRAHPHQTTFWTGHYPKLSPTDIIVEATGRRWRIADVSYTEKRRATVHQVMAVTEVAKGDIEYKLPVEEIDIPADPSGFVGFYPSRPHIDLPEGSGLL